MGGAEGGAGGLAGHDRLEIVFLDTVLARKKCEDMAGLGDRKVLGRANGVNAGTCLNRLRLCPSVV